MTGTNGRTPAGPKGKRPRPTRPPAEPDAHLARIRAEEAAVEQIEEAAGRLRGLARTVLTGGDPSRNSQLRDAMASSQAGWYLVVTLAVFLAADQVLGFVLSVMGPEIRAGL